MTPADYTSEKNLLKSRAALHRISVVDGSFAISGKHKEVDASLRKSIVD